MPSDTGDFDALVAELRRVQELVASIAPPAGVIDETRRDLARIADGLLEHVVAEDRQLSGTRFDRPGRAQAMVPVLDIDERADRAEAGRVAFGRFYFGSRGAVHAGAIPLAFAELLGWLATRASGSPTRTALLHVDFVGLTPVGEDLRIAGQVDREEGRKWFLSGTLHAGDRLCARAEGLYLTPRPDASRTPRAG